MTDLTLGIALDLLVRFGILAHACVNVARLLSEQLVALHLTEVELEVAQREYHDKSQQGVYVKGNGADKDHQTVTLQLARNGGRPAGDGCDDTNGSGGGVNDVGQLRSGDLELVGDGAHNGTDRQTAGCFGRNSDWNDTCGDICTKGCCSGYTGKYIAVYRFDACGSIDLYVN